MSIYFTFPLIHKIPSLRILPMLKITTSLTGHRELNNGQNLIQLTPKRRMSTVRKYCIFYGNIRVHARRAQTHARTYAHIYHQLIALNIRELNFVAAQ